MNMKRLFVSWCLSILLIFAIVTGAQAYSNILAFGDSLSDNGQYYSNDPYGATGNTNPYDGFGFRRFSNGPVWVEYLAQNLSISSSPLPLLDLAYGGATSGLDNPAANQTILGLQWQVAAYGSYFHTISAQTLVTVWAGGNDMFNYVKGAAGEAYAYNEAAYQNFLNGNYNPGTAAANISTAIENLIAMGGRNFLVPNLIISGDYLEWKIAFDAALLAQLYALNGEYGDNGVHFFLLDWNKVNLDGIALDNIVMPDGVHPTTAHHERIAEIAWTKIPEPASILLLIIGIVGLAGARRRMR